MDMEAVADLAEPVPPQPGVVVVVVVVPVQVLHQRVLEVALAEVHLWHHLRELCTPQT
jgi:hypothetical protein